jgi:hypothetical protein
VWSTALIFHQPLFFKYAHYFYVDCMTKWSCSWIRYHCSRIWGSHSSNCEDGCLLDCSAMYSGRSLPTFQKHTSTRLHGTTTQKTAIFRYRCSLDHLFDFTFIQGVCAVIILFSHTKLMVQHTIQSHSLRQFCCLHWLVHLTHTSLVFPLLVNVVANFVSLSHVYCNW